MFHALFPMGMLEIQFNSIVFVVSENFFFSTTKPIQAGVNIKNSVNKNEYIYDDFCLLIM